MTNSLNIVTGYILDKTAKEPTVIDYENIGILSVDNGNIEYVNEAVSGGVYLNILLLLILFQPWSLS